MRNTLIAIVILLIALSLFTLGIVEGQYGIINSLYQQMSIIA